VTEEIRQIIEELKLGLTIMYRERLKGVFLFGSFSRGEADDESGIDVLIVLDKIERYGDEVDRSNRLIADLSLKCGRSISCVFATERRWKEDQTNFFLNVREEAIPA
jgi:predicted nucleotidyltransferase